MQNFLDKNKLNFGTLQVRLLVSGSLSFQLCAILVLEKRVFL